MSSEHGFSLVEVVMGLAIFSVGALASAMLITASLGQNRVAKERTRVSSVVSQRLEELRSRPWYSVGGEPSLQAGGTVLDEEALKNYSYGSLPYGYFDDFNYDLDGPAEYGDMKPFYVVMWRIEDLNDSGLDFKRIIIRGVSMRWNNLDANWQPITSFDHVAMIFREIKSQ